MRRRAVLALVVVVAIGMGATAASADADQSLWVPASATAGPTASVTQLDSTWSMIGSVPCVPDYSMTVAFSSPPVTDSPCAKYAGQALLGSSLEYKGAVGRVDIRNRWVADVAPSGSGGAGVMLDD